MQRAGGLVRPLRVLSADGQLLLNLAASYPTSPERFCLFFFQILIPIITRIHAPFFCSPCLPRPHSPRERFRNYNATLSVTAHIISVLADVHTGHRRTAAIVVVVFLLLSLRWYFLLSPVQR